MTSHSLQSFCQTDAQALGSQTRSRVSRPTIILVHGSWQSPEVFTFLIPRLEKAGYSVFAPSLPSSGANPPLKNFDEDVKVIRSTVRSVLDSGKDVVIVMHSYGAIPGCEALKGLKDEGGPPAQGRYNSGKVLKLAFLAAMVVPVGQSTWKAERGESFPGFECKVNVHAARSRSQADQAGRHGLRTRCPYAVLQRFVGVRRRVLGFEDEATISRVCLNKASP